MRKMIKARVLLAILIAGLMAFCSVLAGCGSGALKDVKEIMEADPGSAEADTDTDTDAGIDWGSGAIQEGPGNGQAPEEEPEPPAPPEPELPELSEMEQLMGELQKQLGFGFAGEEGRFLLGSWPDEYKEIFPEISPQEFTLAVGPYAELVPIKFEAVQEGSENSNNRDNVGNFANLPGYIYRPVSTRLTQNQTYVLTTAGLLMDTMMSLSRPSWRGNYPAMDEEMIDEIKTLKGRSVVWGKQLATAVNGVVVGIVLFDRRGDDMLFSIVYRGEDKTLFWDCHAEYDEEATWRVGGGEEPGSFTPMFLARLDEGLVMLLTWSASDGENIVLLYEEDDAFERWDVFYDRAFQ